MLIYFYLLKIEYHDEGDYKVRNLFLTTVSAKVTSTLHIRGRNVENLSCNNKNNVFSAPGASAAPKSSKILESNKKSTPSRVSLIWAVVPVTLVSTLFIITLTILALVCFTKRFHKRNSNCCDSTKQGEFRETCSIYYDTGCFS